MMRYGRMEIEKKIDGHGKPFIEIWCNGECIEELDLMCAAQLAAALNYMIFRSD
jgi:hypothetical protein